jgi:hypothetical protein
MSYQIVAESKAWNKADLIDGQINVLWANEIDFNILEYQVRNEFDEVVFRSEFQDDIQKWLVEQRKTVTINWGS